MCFLIFEGLQICLQFVNLMLLHLLCFVVVVALVEVG